MKDTVISLFDKTGTMLKPWYEAGYNCYMVDIDHPVAYDNGGITKLAPNFAAVHFDLRRPWLPPVDPNRLAFVSAFPPCDHLAVSGARWFKGKGLRSLSMAIELFATAVEFCEWANAPYMIENPVSTISTHWRKPDWVFHPYEYTALCHDDNYTKKTCIWAGHGFVMPNARRDPALPAPDDRIHKAQPSTDRSDIRSATPLGFARAVFETNEPTANQQSLAE